MLACLCIAVPSWLLGKKFPIIGGPVIAIIAGMVITLMIKDKSALESGIKYTSKKILQYLSLIHIFRQFKNELLWNSVAYRK